MKRLVWLAFLLAFLFLALLLVILPAQAQTKSLMPVPRIQFLDTSGNPLANGHVHTYISLTTTNQATYTDSGGGTPNANPVLLDAGGFAGIWLTSDESYTITVHNSSEVLQWSVDNVTTMLTLTNTWTGTQTFKCINGVCFVDGYAGADFGVKLQACIDAASAGDTCDGRGFTSAQSIATTVTQNKAIVVQLPCVDITTSVTRAFDFPAAGSNSSMFGCNKGSTSSGGTRIIAASSAVTQLIRIEGTGAGSRVSKIILRDFTIEGSANADGQVGIAYKFFTDIKLTRVQFVELGQAEDFDMGALVSHEDVNYFACGTGGTAATACIRVENRAGGGILNQIRWSNSLWEGDTVAGNLKQGTAIHFVKGSGGENNTHWLTNSFIDYDSTNADFPIIFFDDIAGVHVEGNTISASNIVTANAVIDVTGSSGNLSDRIQIENNAIAFSNTVPGVRLDWGNNNTVSGGFMRGGGSGTAVTITSNHGAGTVGPFTMVSTDTPISNSSTTLITLSQETGSDTAWHILEALALGATPATAGEIRLPSLGTIRGRNAGDSANLTMVTLDANDDVLLGDAAGTEVRVAGQLGFGNVVPQATGIIGPNNECYQALDAGGSSVCIAVVDASDVLKRGNDSDLSAVLDTPLEGTLSNTPRWIFKQVDHTDMTAAATADDFVLWTLPANTMIHDVVGTVVTAWEAVVGLSVAVCSVGTAAGGATDLALDDNFFSAATVYELHDATASGGKGSLLFDSTDKFAPFMLVAGGDIEIQCDLTGDDHADTNAGQARIYILVSQPLGNTTTEAN